MERGCDLVIDEASKGRLVSQRCFGDYHDLQLVKPRHLHLQLLATRIGRPEVVLLAGVDACLINNDLVPILERPPSNVLQVLRDELHPFGDRYEISTSEIPPGDAIIGAQLLV